MIEHGENWEKQLQTVIIEIAGMGEIFSQTPLFLQLLAKLEGLLIKPVPFETYRKTVFESISLIQSLEGEKH